MRDDLPYGHPQFAQLTPCACRVAAEAARRVMRAQTASDAAPDRAECLFSAYDTGDNREAWEAAQAWARGEGAPWLFFWGGYGTGKTHLLGGAFWTLIDAGKAPIYTVSPLLLKHIRKGIDAGDGEYSARLEAVMECPVLILDDLGTEKRTAWTDETLYALLDYRYRLKLPLAVATNKTPDELEERIASRLQHQRLSRMVLMLGHDRRLA